MRILTNLITMSLALALTTSAWAMNNYDVSKMSAEEAYQHGKLLRSQFKNSEAKTYLQYAADNGYPNGAYLYAMESMGNQTNPRAVENAIVYLTNAAELGSRPALRYLYRQGEWLSEAKRRKYQTQYYNSLIELGAQSPGVAYLCLSDYFYAEDKELSAYYLSKAIEFELPSAHMISAQRLESEEGSFFFASDRVAQVEQHYLQAAELGYIPAIKKYITILEQKGKYKEALTWREKALTQGDITSLVSLGAIYSGSSVRYGFVEQDLAKAKAYFELYLDNAGQDSLSDIYKQTEYNHKNIIDKITVDKELQVERIKDGLSNVDFFYNYDFLWSIN
ncbi:sel1 repeat family protein [Vibrio panuliri]|nr:sel1 repeat family protein [Vibrio panuliri]